MASIDDGSEELFDMCCTPCSKKGSQNSQGVYYCEHCMEVFCPTCLDFHARFSAMTSHKVVSVTAMPVDRPRGVPPGSMSPCTEHGDQSITMYCKDHDTVGCPVCVALNHRSCQDLSYIPNVARGIKVSEGIQETRRDLEETRQLLVKLKTKTENVLPQFDKRAEVLIKTIEEFKSSLTKLIETMAVAAKNQVQIRFDTLKSQTEKQVAELDSHLTNIELKQSRLESTAHVDESQLFVEMKLGKLLLQAAQDSLQQVVASPSHVGFLPSLDLEKVVREQRQLGKVIEVKSYNVLGTGESGKCDITDICQLCDGTILLADNKHSCLKRLDKMYTLVDIFTLKNPPESICVIGSLSEKSHKIAVTQGESGIVELFQVSTAFISVSKFSTGAFCNGIAHKDGILFVLCIPKKERSRVFVYNLEGKLLRHLTQYESGNLLLSPSKIAVNDLGNKLYIADMHSGLVVLSTDGRVLSGNRDIRPATGICNGQDGHVYISSLAKQMVVAVDTRNNRANIRAVLTTASGLESAQCVCFDRCFYEQRGQTRLIVSLTGLPTEIVTVIV